MKILVIDDDDEINNIISLTLRVGFPDAEVLSAKLGRSGMKLIKTEMPDLVILDLALPDISGFHILKEIRLVSDTPVVVLTVSGEESNVVKALEMRANDYIIKPFRQMELLARLRSAVRLSTAYAKDNICHKINSIYFYPSMRKIVYDNKTTYLTPTEFTILLHLARNKGKAVSYSSIANLLWGRNYPKTHDAIRVYIQHLRKKMEPNPTNPRIIITNPGVGYSLSNV